MAAPNDDPAPQPGADIFTGVHFAVVPETGLNEQKTEKVRAFLLISLYQTDHIN